MVTREVTLDTGDTETITLGSENADVMLIIVDPGNSRISSSPNPPISSYIVTVEVFKDGAFSEVMGSPLSSQTIDREETVIADIGQRVRITLENTGNRGTCLFGLDGLSEGAAIRAVARHRRIGGSPGAAGQPTARLYEENNQGPLPDGSAGEFGWNFTSYNQNDIITEGGDVAGPPTVNEPGTYRIVGNLTWVDAAAGGQLEARHSEGPLIGSPIIARDIGAGEGVGVPVTTRVHSVETFAVDDPIRILAANRSGGSATVRGGEEDTYVLITKISDIV